MPKDRTGLNKPTKFTANILGGPAKLRGKYILADIPQVCDPALWKTDFKDVGLVVCCLASWKEVEYPPQATAQSQLLRVDMRNKELRNPQFENALPLVEKTLEAGKDVLVHCKESYHRAPIAVAAFYRQTTGIGYQVVRPTYRTFMEFDKQPISNILKIRFCRQKMKKNGRNRNPEQ